MSAFGSSPMGDAVKQIEADRRAAQNPKPEPGTKPEKPPVNPNSDVRAFVDRIVRLEEEKKELAASIKEVYEETRSAGYEPKAIKIAVKREMETPEKRAAREAVEAEAELILAALGEFASSPLGEAAVRAGRG